MMYNGHIYGMSDTTEHSMHAETYIINPRRACAARVTVVVLCVCLSVCRYVCMYVCLSEHAILAVRAVRSITKDAIVLSVRFAAILKRRFLKIALFES